MSFLGKTLKKPRVKEELKTNRHEGCLERGYFP